MSTLILGTKPDPLTVYLTTGADFRCTLRLDTNWPTGSTLALKFAATTWSATISGRDATFNVDKATADAIADAAAVRLNYTDGATVDETWAIGTVVRYA